MKTFMLILVLLNCLTLQAAEIEVQKADQIARDTAAWFTYTTGPMVSAQQGQCGDYAVMFILNYNASVGMNVARLVTTNNPIPSGTYRLGDKTDVAQMGFYGFSSESSGFLSWKGQLYVYYPILGAYPIFLEKEWTPKVHFGIDMLDKNQIHTWASVDSVSVDPTYFDLWPDKFSSPLGIDQ
ncbi:hypothetical protein K2X05_03675 [bacterium]|nr:hypothetical protein [bacterium]